MGERDDSADVAAAMAHFEPQLSSEQSRCATIHNPSGIAQCNSRYQIVYNIEEAYRNPFFSAKLQYESDNDSPYVMTAKDGNAGDRDRFSDAAYAMLVSHAADAMLAGWNCGSE